MTRDLPQPNRATARPPLRVAVVGATGAVGQECLRVLEQRRFPLAELRLLASARSAGSELNFAGQPLRAQELTAASLAGLDLAFFCAGRAVSKQYAPAAVEAGAVVIDNSSCFRMEADVPLVVPEVNPEAIAKAGIGLRDGQTPGRPGIIANPNCSTIIMLVAVTPLHRAAGVKRIVVSTYQAASGAGAQAMRELEQQTREVLDPANHGQAVTQEVFPFQYAFNLFSHNSSVQGNGYNQEEMKMVHETHKIWGDPGTAITATCVRVPVMRAHAESINLTFENPLSEDDARAILARAPGVTVLDDRESNRFPTPLNASHQDNILAGRIRQDCSNPDGTGLDLFLCGDQVRKGAALNAVQIAERLL